MYLCRRDIEDRDREKQEAKDREALKNMTEAERRAWEAAHPKVRHLSTAALLHDSPQHSFTLNSLTLCHACSCGREGRLVAVAGSGTRVAIVRP